MTSRFQVIPAAYVVLRRHGRVLLQLRQNTGYMDDHWASGAAGHVEAGESVVQAACREAAEELGVAIEPSSLTALCAMHRSNGPEPIEQRVDFFFSVEEWVGTPAITEPVKVADLRWFALDELPDNVVPHERFVLDQIDDIPSIVTFGFPSVSAS